MSSYHALLCASLNRGLGTQSVGKLLGIHATSVTLEHTQIPIPLVAEQPDKAAEHQFIAMVTSQHKDALFESEVLSLGRR